MTIAEAKSIIDLKMNGDNNSWELSPIMVKEALGEILRRTAPKSYIADTFDEDENQLATSADWFRRISSTQHLERAVVIDPLTDEWEIPIEEELAMAVVYYVCSLTSKKNNKFYEDKAKGLVAIYETNMIYLEEDEE